MAQRKKKPGKFQTPASIERRYTAQLRKVARHTAGIINPHIDGATLINEVAMMKRINGYIDILDPWANNLVGKTIKEVDAANKRAFKARSKVVAEELKRESESSVGMRAAEIHKSQVDLIKTIPRDAAERAQKIAREAAIQGTRAGGIEDLVQQMADTENYALFKATRIARTEISKANSALMQARAESIGLDRYYWRGAGDADMRDSHRAMMERSDAGETFLFSQPPEVDEGGAYNPGEIYNCRCYADPFIPEAQE